MDQIWQQARSALRRAQDERVSEEEQSSAAREFMRRLRAYPDLIELFLEPRPTVPKPKKARVPAPEFILWFGKHKDKMLKDIPSDYLEWLLQNATQLTPRTVEVITEVLASRT